MSGQTPIGDALRDATARPYAGRHRKDNVPQLEPRLTPAAGQPYCTTCDMPATETSPGHFEHAEPADAVFCGLVMTPVIRPPADLPMNSLLAAPFVMAEIIAEFNRLGIDDRAHRIEWLNEAIGGQVSGLNDLSMAELLTVRDVLRTLRLPGSGNS